MYDEENRRESEENFVLGGSQMQDDQGMSDVIAETVSESVPEIASEQVSDTVSEQIPERSSYSQDQSEDQLVYQSPQSYQNQQYYRGPGSYQDQRFRGRSGYQDQQQYQGQSAYQSQQRYQNNTGYYNQQQYQNPAGYQSGQGYQSQPGYQSQQGYQGQTSYQSGQTRQSQQTWSPIPETKETKSGKKSGTPKRVAGIVAAALLFGAISGGTMAGVNMLAGSMKEEPVAPVVTTVPQVTERQTLSDEEIARVSRMVSENMSDGKVVVMDVSDIVEQVMPSVVAINNTIIYQSNNPWFGRQTYEAVGSGSGIIIGQNDTELLIVTNNHVVEDASELTVTFIDDTAVNATIKGTDSESDLAIVAIPLTDISAETLGVISIAEMGDSDELKVGQGVIAIGNALGYGQSVTVGYVSALNREITTDGKVTRHLLQTDAAINPGNSGGALLNTQGQVIGINAAKYSDTSVEGVGYAIPISQAEEIISTLMVRRSGERVESSKAGYLGIQGLTVDDSMIHQLDMPAGVYVYRIVEGGAASKTDLREKDIITKFDGQSVRTMASLQDLLQYYEAGETVEIVVESLENGEYVERAITVTLGQQVSAE